jgi:two-component system chemotaxis response regulator CheB
LEYELIVIGASWGGLEAVSRVLADLDGVDVPVVIAQHRRADVTPEGFAYLFQRHTSRPVHEVEDKDPIERGQVYLAPPDYHLLVERGAFALSTEEHVHYSRPSIDVLFESAADAYGPATVGVVLTGANEDGAAGLARIQEKGGVVVVQDPETAEKRRMPEAAIEATSADLVLPLEEIGAFLRGLCGAPSAVRSR